MSRMGQELLLHCRVALLFSLCGVVGGELCYIDNNTGFGVYCEPNCCGSNPTYCCDKDGFITRNAVFGALGVLFIVSMSVCFFCKKMRNKKKKKATKALAKRKAPTTTPAPVSVSVVSSGGIDNQGFSDQTGSRDNVAQVTPGRSTGQDISLGEIPLAASPTSYSSQVGPPPSGPMYKEHDYPPPATPTLPAASPVRLSECPADNMPGSLVSDGSKDDSGKEHRF